MARDHGIAECLANSETMAKQRFVRLHPTYLRGFALRVYETLPDVRLYNLKKMDISLWPSGDTPPKASWIARPFDVTTNRVV